MKSTAMLASLMLLSCGPVLIPSCTAPPLEESGREPWPPAVDQPLPVCGIGDAAVTSTAQLIVAVRRVNPRSGSLVVGLCGDRTRWLATDGYDFGTVHELGGANGSADSDSSEILVQLDAVPAGRWALSVFHDLDGDGELDRGPFGIPAEPWGFGNDPPALGAARFDAALIDVAAPQTRVVVTLRGGAGAR